MKVVRRSDWAELEAIHKPDITDWWWVEGCDRFYTDRQLINNFYIPQPDPVAEKCCTNPARPFVADVSNAQLAFVATEVSTAKPYKDVCRELLALRKLVGEWGMHREEFIRQGQRFIDTDLTTEMVYRANIYRAMDKKPMVEVDREDLRLACDFGEDYQKRICAFERLRAKQYKP